jgi:hypothetical protein
MPTHLMSFINKWLNQFSFIYAFEIKIVKSPRAIDVNNANDNYFHLFLV